MGVIKIEEVVRLSIYDVAYLSVVFASILFAKSDTIFKIIVETIDNLVFIYCGICTNNDVSQLGDLFSYQYYSLKLSNFF